MTREEAIKIVQSATVWTDEERDALAMLIPELAESDDERMLREIKRYIKEQGDKPTGLPNGTVAISDMIAWLEKQEEEEGYEAIPVESTLEYKLGFNAGKETRWSPTKEQVNALETTVRLSNFGCDKERRKILLSLLEQLKQSEEKQKEQKSNVLQNAFDKSKKDYTLEEKSKASDYAESILPTSIIYGESEEEYKIHTIIEAAFIAGQKEQKSTEWSDDCREEGIQTTFAFYTYKDDPSTLYLSNVFVEETSRNKGFGTKILTAAEKVAETLGITSIRLKVKRDNPANVWYRKHGYGLMTFEGDYDWLEKDLEYLKPIHWKPSKEQMSSLNYFIKLWGNSDDQLEYTKIFNNVKSLRDDLEELM